MPVITNTNNANINNFLGFLDKTMISSIIDLLILCCISAILSVLIVKAIRYTFEKTLINKKVHNIILWFTNAGITLGLSFAIVLLFAGKGSLLRTGMEIAMVFCVSLALSILLYEVFVRTFFKFVDIVVNKLEDRLLETEIEKEKSIQNLYSIKVLNRMKIVNTEVTNQLPDPIKPQQIVNTNIEQNIQNVNVINNPNNPGQ